MLEYPDAHTEKHTAWNTEPHNVMCSTSLSWTFQQKKNNDLLQTRMKPVAELNTHDNKLLQYIGFLIITHVHFVYFSALRHLLIYTAMSPVVSEWQLCRESPAGKRNWRAWRRCSKDTPACTAATFPIRWAHPAVLNRPQNTHVRYMMTW